MISLLFLLKYIHKMSKNAKIRCSLNVENKSN